MRIRTTRPQRKMTIMKELKMENQWIYAAGTSRQSVSTQRGRSP
jgi:hypothetical protein